MVAEDVIGLRRVQPLGVVEPMMIVRQVQCSSRACRATGKNVDV